MKGGTVRPADHSTSTVTTMKDGLFSVALSLTGVRSRNRDIGFHESNRFSWGVYHTIKQEHPVRPVHGNLVPTSNPLPRMFEPLLATRRTKKSRQGKEKTIMAQCAVHLSLIHPNRKNVYQEVFRATDETGRVYGEKLRRMKAKHSEGKLVQPPWNSIATRVTAGTKKKRWVRPLLRT